MGMTLEFSDGRPAESIEQEVIAIGRDPSNDVILDDLTVSRHHAVLVRFQTRPDRWFVRDVGSLQGTRIGGRLLNQVEVRAGSTIEIGRNRLTITLDEFADSSPQEQWLPYREVDEKPSAPQAARPAKTEAPKRVKQALGPLVLPSDYRDLAHEALKQAGLVKDIRNAFDAILPLVCGHTKASRGFALLFGRMDQAEPRPLACGITDPSRQIDVPRNWLSTVRVGTTFRSGRIVAIPLLLDEGVRGTICLEFSGDGASAFSPEDDQAIRQIGILNLKALPGVPPKEQSHAAPADGVIPWPMRVVGVSPEMRRVMAQARDAARSGLRVLIQGETGVGKTLHGEEIHRLSGRKSDAFVHVNAAGIPAETLEAQLWGFGRNAPYANIPPEGVPGQIERAHQGTLLVDEVGDMPTPLQAKLLTAFRSANTCVVRRIGPHGEEIEVDVKVVSATTVDLHEAVQRGHFRRELYNRIAGLVIRIPPLRERKEDIPILAHFFLDNLAAEMNTRTRGVSREAVRLLCDRDWPNNVLELYTCIKRAVMKGHPVIGPGDLEFDAPALAVTSSAPAPSPAPSTAFVPKPLWVVERDHIKAILEWEGGNKERSADRLDISPMTLYDAMDRYLVPRNHGKPKPLFSQADEERRNEIMGLLGETGGDAAHVAQQFGYADAKDFETDEMDRLWIPRRHGWPVETTIWGPRFRERRAKAAPGPEDTLQFA